MAENNMDRQHLQKLYRLTWEPELTSPYPEYLAEWLYEQGSMTAKLNQFCQHIRVEVMEEKFVGQSALLTHEQQALAMVDCQQYWIREITLYGDDEAWLIGRTVIPEASLQGTEQQLVTIGTRPLGHYLFSVGNLSRDFIEIGHYQALWGRRSLLRLSNKPLLLTELFLPASPAYLKTR